MTTHQRATITVAKTTETSSVGFWNSPAVISTNNFKFKSLSEWSFNIAVGCSHACRFCYVPDVATLKQAEKLAGFGVKDPDAEWGKYVLLRQWDEDKFLASLHRAENTPRDQLKRDGNRAVIYCSTTDPYQVIYHPDPVRQKELSDHARFLVRRSLELIRDQSTLNVRILTRSPLARTDFDLFKSFGRRLVFGMSLPTMRNDLAKVYEPTAPAPSQRLEALRAANEFGLHVYVALAPTFAECDESDLRATLKAVAGVDPITIFHESVNIRAENIERIKVHAASLKPPVNVNTTVFANAQAWQEYALGQMLTVQRLATEMGLLKRLHLWPDPELGTKSSFLKIRSSQRKHLNTNLRKLGKNIDEKYFDEKYYPWIKRWWDRVSEWPNENGHEQSTKRELDAARAD